MGASRVAGASREEEGQVLPLLLVAVVALLAIGVSLMQVGKSSTLRAEAQTAADAAALAAAQDLKRQLAAQLATGGYTDPAALSDLTARAAAERYADRNGGRLVTYERAGLQVQVEVETVEVLAGDAVPDGADGRRGEAVARAELALDYALGPVPRAGGGAPAIPEADLARVAERAGLDDVPPWSSLRRYGSDCRTGVDVAHLADEMKVAILRAEALLSQPLSISSGYRTVACQAAISPGANPGGRVAPPGRSMHNYGMAIDVSPYAPLASVAAQVGLCQPFPAPDDDPFHFSLAGGRECGGRSGPLGGGQAFGGDVGSFVTFDVRLVPVT